MSIELRAAPAVDLPRSKVPEFVFTDWDSTQAATSTNSFLEVCEASGLPADSVREAHTASKNPSQKPSGSFQPYYALQDALHLERGTSVPAFDGAYAEIVGDRHLYDDSGAFFSRLDQAGMPHGVLTYGPWEWQFPKIRNANGYKGHIEALPHTHKDEYVEELRDPDDGTWKFKKFVNGVAAGLLIAESVVVIENKGENVAAMVEEGTAFVLDRTGKEAGKWPEEQTISTLDQLQPVNGRLIKQKLVVASARIAMPQTSVQYVPVRSQFPRAA